MRPYLLGTVVACLVLLIGCQSGAPTATTPGSAATPGGEAAVTSTPALGIDFRVPPTRAPRTTPAAVLSPASKPNVASSPSPGATATATPSR